MALTTQISNLAVRLGTEFKTVRTEIDTLVGNLANLDTTDKTNIVAAINEALIASGGSSVANLDDLLDVVIATVATGNILRFNGSEWVNVNPLTYFDAAGSAAAAQAASQPLDATLSALASLTTAANKMIYSTAADTFTTTDLTVFARSLLDDGDAATARATLGVASTSEIAAAYQPLDSDLTSIAALATTSYGRAFLTLANQAALMALLSSATETVPGIVELATTAEAVAGSDTTRVVTPAGLKAGLDALVAAAPGTLDTLDELAAALGDDPNFATTISTALGNRVRVDTAAQGLDNTQKSNARTNIDVYSKAEVGDPETNFVTTFEGALV